MQYFRFGRKEIHPKYATEHFLVVGCSGSGKSTLINMLLGSLGVSRRNRMMIYDSKQEILPLLYQMVGSDTSRVKVLHPFDVRSCAWSLAEDIDGPLSARQLATILIPDGEGGSNADAFFLNAVRDLLTGVILAFINCVPNPKSWTFRDIVLTLLYQPYLLFILGMDHTREGQPFPYSARLRDSYLSGDPESSDPRTTGNIRSTINTKLSLYEPIAAVWDEAQKKEMTFSLSEWAKDECRDILVLGNDESARASIDPVNQAIFKRASELVLARRETTPDEKASGANQTWIFLDEVREAGKLDGLSRLLTKSRSKGACLVLGFQDFKGMCAVYGEEVAHEICGQCNNVAILKLNGSTAEWATELFGRRLTRSQSRSRGMSSEGGMQMSREAGEEERPWVYTADLLNLPLPSPSTSLQGFFKSPDTDPEKHDFRVELDWKTEIAPYLPQPHPDAVKQAAEREISQFAARDMRPVSEHYLKPWTPEDWERLGLDRILSSPIAYNAPPHLQPRVHTEPKTLRQTRNEQSNAI